MSKTIVITGANSGIGLALTEIYLKRGDKVFAICRQTTDELNNTGDNIIENIDVSHTNYIKKLQQEMKTINRSAR